MLGVRRDETDERTPNESGPTVFAAGGRGGSGARGRNVEGPSVVCWYPTLIASCGERRSS